MSPTEATPYRLLLTAGPTHEPIDAVRYIANRSSGRMGVALAEAALARGLPTTLLLGPVPVRPPENTLLVVERFRTAADLAAALARRWPEHDVLIMAAAVADCRPVAPDPAGKLRRSEARLTLELEPTPDLLAGLKATTRPDQTVIGFALEPPDRLHQSALEKLQRKGLDAIVANPLATMDAECITATVHVRDGEPIIPPPDLPKPAFAQWLLDQVPGLRRTLREETKGDRDAGIGT